MTILASAFVHEYVLAMVLGFFNPVLMLEFGGLGGVSIMVHVYNYVF